MLLYEHHKSPAHLLLCCFDSGLLRTCECGGVNFAQGHLLLRCLSQNRRRKVSFGVYAR